MGIFGNREDVLIEGELKNPDELQEMYIFDELCMLPDEKKQEFINSQEAAAMVEAGIISRKTLVRLSKADDLSRRIKMAAFQLAKDNDDMLWTQLAKNRVKERELIGKITAKYGSKAQRAARVGQKDYLKNKMPLSFMRK